MEKKILFVSTVQEHSPVGPSRVVHLINEYFGSYAEVLSEPLKIPLLPLLIKNRSAFYIPYLKRAIELDSKYNFDKIIINNSYMGYQFRRAFPDKKIVSFLVDYRHQNCMEKNPFKKWRWTNDRKNEIKSLESSDLVLTCSQILAEDAFYNYNLKTKPSVLVHGVDITKFTYHTPKINRDQPIKLLFVKSEYKGGSLLEIREALELLPFKTILINVGNGLQLSSSNKVTVENMGKLYHEDLIELYSKVDLFCLPSKSEALGLSIIEAMASGLPVITNQIEGIKEVTKDGALSWNVSSINPREIAKTINDCIDHHEKAIEKSIEARAFIEENYTIEKMKSGLEKVILNRGNTIG